MKRHLVLFVAMRDAELEAMTLAEPTPGQRRDALGDRALPDHGEGAGAEPRCRGWARRSSMRRPGASDRNCSTAISSSSGGAGYDDARQSSCAAAASASSGEADWKRLEGPAQPRRARRRGGADRRRADRNAEALSRGALFTVGGARDLARSGADRLSREPVHPRLLLRLWRTQPAGPARGAFLPSGLAAGGAASAARPAGLGRRDDPRRRSLPMCW